MPRIASVKSLQELCLKNIAKNIDSWWQYHVEKGCYDSPFESMPSGLLEQLAELLRDCSTQRKKKYFELLITSQLETLNMAWLTNCFKEGKGETATATADFADHLISLILFRHPQLRVLKWRHELSVGSWPVYQMFLPIFPKLQELYIAYTSVTNRCLHVIGANCKELRILDAVDCYSVTDDGIEGLCAIFDDSGSKHERLGQCKSIHTLKITNARITKKGVYLALKYLPALRVFGFHFSFQILAELQEDECNVSNLLDSLIDTSYLDRPFLPYKSGSLGRVASLCSSLKNVELNVMPGLTDRVLLGLLELNSLCQLSLFGDPPGDDEITFVGGVVPLLKAFGSSLTFLSLCGVEGLVVNVRAIIGYCPELEYLKLDNETGDFIYAPLDGDEQPPSKQIKKEMILKKLKELTLFCPPEESESTKIVLEMLLSSSPSLVNVKLEYFYKVDDYILQKAFDVHQFRNLQSLVLDSCLALTKYGIYLFMNENNSLKKLGLHSCELLTKEFANELRDIARQRNWDVDITHS